MPRPEYKDRQFNLIFPSAVDLDEWQAEAEKCGVSLCKYILAMAEKGKNMDASPRLDLLREAEASREELGKLRRNLKDKDAALEKYETELFRLRNQAFIQPLPRGSVDYGEELIRLLKQGRNWNGPELLSALGVDPKNSDAMAIILRQLQVLQDLGLVLEGATGWRWVG
jgi:hypothetical protein